MGLYFVNPSGNAILAKVLAVNEPKTLKAVIPPGLTVGTAYTLRVVTQSSAKGGGALLKTVRTMVSDFTVTAHS